ncbi:hypothetical protein M2165_002476 [Variovorax sp. TBS-050B]|nr:hypothetical protein [Variovorax sp. TBS-050B]
MLCSLLSRACAARACRQEQHSRDGARLPARMGAEDAPLSYVRVFSARARWVFRSTKESRVNSPSNPPARSPADDPQAKTAATYGQPMPAQRSMKREAKTAAENGEPVGPNDGPAITDRKKPRHVPATPAWAKPTTTAARPTASAACPKSRCARNEPPGRGSPKKAYSRRQAMPTRSPIGAPTMRDEPVNFFFSNPPRTPRHTKESLTWPTTRTPPTPRTPRMSSRC